MEGEERAKEGKGRWWKWMIRGLEADETAEGEGEGGREGKEGQVGGVLSAVEGEAREVLSKAEEGMRDAFSETESKAGSVLQALEDKRREGQRPIKDAGGHDGPLDQVADHAVEAGKAKGGWTSWMIGKE